MANIFGSLDEARSKLAALVERYARNRDHYRASPYKEEEVRAELITPLFEALGWDVTNKAGLAEAYKDVIHEESIKIGEWGTSAPDYTFRVGGQRKFFVEAKKPFVDIKNDPGPAYQLRRYAWSAKLPLSILTDFEELAVYDTRKRPAEGDKASVARVQLLSYEDYLRKLDDLWGIFSKQAVYQGSFDRFAEESLGKRGTSEVDAEFLKELEAWRDALARNFALRNDGLTVEELNFAVQATIDRILLLRIAEGRGVEEYGRLLALAGGGNVYPRLVGLYKKADSKYNAGLFDLKTDRLTPELDLDDKVLHPILEGLYYPRSPYEFSVLSPEILGQVYEQFLGKVIRLTAGGRAKIEEKPEVKKAGGVYYTPRYIVDYIVKHTVGEQTAGKSPNEMAKLRILDPACGSGSFLLAVFQHLLDAHLAWYRDHDPAKHRDAVYLGAGADWRLTTTEKRRILLNSIYGVDIDRQAVEVTKLSLLLKVLEGETGETVSKQLTLGERALPSLEKNIKCGNSLIAPSDLRGNLFPDADDLKRINPFDWEQEFPEVVKAGGFDAVIGNPPYIRIQMMKEWAPVEVELYKRLYRSAASGNYDIYVVFVERGLELLNPKGLLGFILPHKFFNANYGQALREIISKGKHLSEVVHFGDQQVFKGATTYTCLLFLDRKGKGEAQIAKVPNLELWKNSGNGSEAYAVAAEQFRRDEWNLVVGGSAEALERIHTMGSRLSEIADRLFQGCITSADPVFLFKKFEPGSKGVTRVFSKALGKWVDVESSLLKPVIRSGGIGRYSSRQGAIVLFPYVVTGTSARLLERQELELSYPRGLDYLLSNRRALEAREDGAFRDAQWYRFGRSQNLGMWEQPKLMVPYMVTRLACYPDTSGGLYFINVTTGGYGITLKATWKPLYVAALMNSQLLDVLFKQLSSTFHGGYHPANKQFIGRLPMRSIDPSKASELATQEQVITLAGGMLSLHARLTAAKTAYDRTLLQRQIDATDQEIDRLVYDLYELTDEEVAIVEKSAASN